MHAAQQQQLQLMGQIEQGYEVEESLFPQIAGQVTGPSQAINVQNQGQVQSFSQMRKNAAAAHNKRQNQTSSNNQSNQATLLNQNRSLSLLGNQGVAAPTCQFPAQFNGPQNKVAQTRSMSNNMP